MQNAHPCAEYLGATRVYYHHYNIITTYYYYNHYYLLCVCILLEYGGCESHDNYISKDSQYSSQHEKVIYTCNSPLHSDNKEVSPSKVNILVMSW